MNYARRAWLGAAVFAAIAPALAQESPKAQSLERVDAKFVCFINKHRFDKEQIPVKVEGRTYYGCCDMCTTKLKDNPATPCDTDPVSGKRVDKAEAVIGVDAQNKVYFFENEANLEKFQSPAAAKEDH